MVRVLLTILLLLPLSFGGKPTKHHAVVARQTIAVSSNPGTFGVTDQTGFVGQGNVTNRAYSYTTSSGAIHGTASTFSVYCDDVNTTTRRFYILIYDASDNELLKKLVDTQTTSTPAWIDIDISSDAVSIAASTTYRLGVQGEYQYTNWYRNASGSTNQYDDVAFGSTTDPWTNDGTVTGTQFAIHIDVE